jgi:hypothetical protein
VDEQQQAEQRGDANNTPESATATPVVRPSRVRKWLRRTLILFVAGMFACVLLYLTRAHTAHPLLARLLVYAAPRFSSYRVDIGRIDGDWIHSLTLTDIQLEGGPDAGLRGCKAGRVSIQFKLSALLDGDWQAVSRIEGESINIDLSLPPSEQAQESDTGWAQLPEQLPSISLTGVDFRMTQGTSVTALSGASLTVEDRAGEDVARLQFVELSLGDGEGDVRLRDFELDLGYRKADIRIDKLRIAGRDLLHESRIDLSALGEGTFDTSLALANVGGPLQVETRIAAGQLHAEFTGTGVEVGELLAPVDGFDFGVHARTDLKAVLDCPLDDFSAMTLRLELDATQVRYSEWSADAVVGELVVRDGAATLHRLEVIDGPNRFTSSELQVPLDLEGADALRQISGVMQVESRDIARLIHGLRLPDGRQVPSHVLDLKVELSGGLALIQSGALVLPDGSINVAAGEFEWVDTVEGKRVNLELTCALGDMSPLADILQSEPWHGSLEGELQISGRLPALIGQATFTGSEVTAAGFPLGSVVLAASGTRQKVRVESLRADGEKLDFKLSGAWDIATGRMEDVSLSAGMEHLDAWSELIDPGGRLEAQATLSGDPLFPTGSVTIDGSDLQLGGVALKGLRLEASSDAGHITVQRLRAESKRGELLATLKLKLPRADEPLRVMMQTFSIMQGENGLSLEQPVRVEFGDGHLRIDTLELSGAAGQLRVDADFDDKQASFDLTSQALDLTPFFIDLLPSDAKLSGINAELHLRRTATSLFASGTGTITELRLASGEPLRELQFEGSLDNGRVEMSRLLVTSEGATLIDAELSLPFDPLAEQALTAGDLTARGVVAWPESRVFELAWGGDLISVEGKIDADIELSGQWKNLRGRAKIAAPAVQLSPRAAIESLVPGPISVRCEIVLGDEIRIDGLDLSVPERGAVSLEGSLGAPLDVIAWTTREDAGDEASLSSFESAPLSLTGQIDIPDASWLAEFTEAVRRLDGQLSGDVTVNGSLHQPEFASRLLLQDAGLRVGGLPQIDKLRVELAFEEDVLRVESFDGEIGAAPFQCHGAIQFEAEQPVVDLTLQGDNLLLARSATLRLRSDLDLKIEGPLDQLLTSGNLRLRHSRLLSNIDFLAWTGGRGGGIESVRRGVGLPSFQEPPLSDMRFDLRVETGEPLDIQGNLLSGAVRADMRIGGTGRVMTPSGRLFVDESLVRIPSGTLTVQSGLIQFDDRNPFVPRVEIQADMRRVGYDLFVNVSGPYDEPEIELSSSPNLAQEDLLHLFLTGRLPVEDSAFGPAAESVTIYIAKDLLGRLASGSKLDDDNGESLVDRFEFINGEEISKGGVSTFEGKFRMLDGLMSERDSLYLVGERDVWEHFNVGVRLVFKFR